MDQDKTSSVPRKVRFTPKAPPRRKEKPVEPTTQMGGDAEDEDSKALLKRVNEHLGRRGPKVDTKSAVQVSFGHGGASSTSIRTYDTRREESIGKSSAGSKDSASSDGKSLPTSPSVPELDITIGSFSDMIIDSSSDDDDASTRKKFKEYTEPWDYLNSNYPTTLPLRRPFSGDPELLDEAEFGDAATNVEYDEKTINPASDLGLLDAHDKPQMFLLQIPHILPSVKRPASADKLDNKETSDRTKLSVSEKDSASVKGKAIAGSSVLSGNVNAPAGSNGKEVISRSTISNSKKSCSLEELPGGYLGKMLVYKSGAIKLKLGNILYDVSPGSDDIGDQHAAAINTVDKQCCVLGDIRKRAIVTPDVDSLLDA